MTLPHRHRERYWDRVHPEPMSGCWLWTGGTNGKGYGRFSVDGKNLYPHRIAVEIDGRPIPPGMQVDHLCRNPSCCNPEHLEIVSQRENIMRGTGPTAKHARKTHCRHGHPFSVENTRIEANGSRRCRTCHRERERRAKRWRES